MKRTATYHRSILILAGIGALVAIGTAVGPAHGDTIYLVRPHSGIQAVDTDLKGGGVKTTTVETELVTNGITFNIDYLDGEPMLPDRLGGGSAPNVGFSDPDTALRNARRQQLENVLAYVAEMLNLSTQATLDIEVDPSENIGSTNFLATAGTFFEGSAGFKKGFTLRRIESGEKPPAAGFVPEIVLTVDFGHNWNLSDQEPAPDEADFFSTLLHEMIHGLGLTSLSSANGTSLILDDQSQSLGVFTVWDSLIVTGSGANVFDGTPPAIRVGVDNLTGGNLLFDGAETFDRYGQGVRPPVYAPTTYAIFSSLSHWDSGDIVGGAVMEHEIVIGRSRRNLAPVDLGALIDLGYASAVRPPVPPRIEVERSDAGNLSFGEVVISTSADGFWTVANTGEGTLTGSLTSDDPAFTIVDDASYALGAGEDTELQVRFTPPSEGQFSATLTFSGGENGPIAVNVTGVGVTSGSLSVVRSDGTGGDFGSTQIGTSIDVVWVLTNTGGSVLEGTASVVGEAFAVAGSGVYTIEPGQNLQIRVRFTPLISGTFTATLTLTGGDTDPLDINLSGTGTQRIVVCSAAAGQPGGGIWGDAAVLALALLTLATLAQVRRKRLSI